MAVFGGLVLNGVIVSGTSSACSRSGCGGLDVLAMGLIILVPVTSGYAGWRLSSRIVQEVVYAKTAP
jgi:hypothetical protein